jgi:hypothetical protein
MYQLLSIIAAGLELVVPQLRKQIRIESFQDLILNQVLEMKRQAIRNQYILRQVLEFRVLGAQTGPVFARRPCGLERNESLSFVLVANM